MWGGALHENTVYECPHIMRASNCDFRQNRHRVNSAFVTGVGEVNLETDCTSQVKNALINCVCAAVCTVLLC